MAKPFSQHVHANRWDGKRVEDGREKTRFQAEPRNAGLSLEGVNDLLREPHL